MHNEAAVSSDEQAIPSDDAAATRSSVAAAETAAAEAAARARQARARAKRLHRDADDRSGRHQLPPRRRRLRWRHLVAAVGVALVCASSAASGSMWWQHRVAAGHRQLAAEFATAARQATVALLTLDYNKIDEHVQRVLDSSTGEFKSSFQQNAKAVGERLGGSKVVTTVDVKDAAVRSMSDNAGVVLVAVQTETTEMNAQPHKQSWRVALSLTRDGGQLKLADVEFIE